MGAQPLVYSRTSREPNNQLYFWPEYRYREHRRGENAIYVREPGPPRLEKGWLWKWLTGAPIGYASPPAPSPVPAVLEEEFESVVDLGLQEIKFRDRVFRRVQIIEGLTGRKIPGFRAEFDVIYVVTLARDGRSSIVRLRYGEG